MPFDLSSAQLGITLTTLLTGYTFEPAVTSLLEGIINQEHPVFLDRRDHRPQTLAVLFFLSASFSPRSAVFRARGRG